LWDAPETSELSHHLAGHGQELGGSEAGLLEAVLEIDPTTSTGKSGISEGSDLAKDLITTPAFRQGIWLHEGIELVLGVGDSLRRQGHAHFRAISQGCGKQRGVEGTGGGPRGQALQLDAADGAMQFGEEEVGDVAAGPRSGSAVQPTEAGGCSRPGTASWVLTWPLKAHMASKRSA